MWLPGRHKRESDIRAQQAQVTLAAEPAYRLLTRRPIVSTYCSINMSKTTVVRTHLLTDRFLIIRAKEIGAGGRPRAIVTRTVEEVRRSYTLPTDAGVARGTGTGIGAGWERGTRWSAETVRTIAATALLVLLTRLSIPLTVIVAIGGRLPDPEEGQQATSSSPY
jgi:hypothetical protein